MTSCSELLQDRMATRERLNVNDLWEATIRLCYMGGKQRICSVLVLWLVRGGSDGCGKSSSGHSAKVHTAGSGHDQGKGIIRKTRASCEPCSILDLFEQLVQASHHLYSCQILLRMTSSSVAPVTVSPYQPCFQPCCAGSVVVTVRESEDATCRARQFDTRTLRDIRFELVADHDHSFAEIFTAQPTCCLVDLRRRLGRFHIP